MTAPAKQRLDLRLVIRESERLALAWQARIEGEDVYAGRPSSPEGEIFRLSYHASGVTHFHLQGRKVPPGGPSPAPRDVVGWQRIASWSVTPLSWGYTPKPDSPRRLNLIIESDMVPIPMASWTVTLVAVERGRPDLVDAALDHYGRQWLRLAHLVAECPHVTLMGVLSTIRVDHWKAIQQEIAARPEPGPLRRALLREREAFVTAHGQCNGFESGGADGRQWIACTTCGVRVERAGVPDGA